MGLIRGLAGVVLSVLALLVGLVAIILCVTVILLPVGLPLLAYASRIFAQAVELMLPRAVSHPVHAADRRTRKYRRKAKKKFGTTRPTMKKVRKRARHITNGGRKKALL